MSVPTDSTHELYTDVVPSRRPPLLTRLMIIFVALIGLLGMMALGLAHIWVPVVLRVGR